MLPFERNSNVRPANPTSTPKYLLAETFILKNIAPISRVNKGVKAFRMPANELSILISAMQNKNAGKKLPNTPARNTRPILFVGIFL
jgi:hypothetical protein